MRPLKLTPAAGGWLHADWGEGKAWLRLARDKRDRLTRIAELRLEMLNPTPEKLRRVPLNRLHAAATMRGAGPVQLELAMRLNEKPTPEMFTEPLPDVGMELKRRYKLKRPAGKLLGDDFYRDVAHAYQSAVAWGLKPRQAIVADAGVKDATVAGWVLEARRRGYLPPAQPGKVSA